MRHLVVLFASVLAACGTHAATSSESPAASAVEAPAPEPSPTARFLIEAAAADFHAHRPLDPGRFRDVRMGHVMTPKQEKQHLLCGQFLAHEGDTEEWVPFATIKTSGYEQWIGDQAAGLCQRKSLVWDDEVDLSSALQRRLESLR